MMSKPMPSFGFAVAAAIIACSSGPADALNANTTLITTSQVGFTAFVKLGHIVNASSNMNSIVVGGAFRVQCPSAITGTIEGQNSRPQSVLIGPNVLSVEVPPGALPAQRELPGFNNVPGGTTLSCGYYWTSNAREGTYTVGIPGMGVPIGGETYSAGDTITFEMYQPGGGDGGGNGSCTH